MGFWENRRLKKVEHVRQVIIEAQDSFRRMDEWKEEIAKFNAKDPLEQVNTALAKVDLPYAGRDLIGRKCLLSWVDFHYRQVHLSTIVGIDATYKDVTLRLATPLNRFTDSSDTILHDEIGWYIEYWSPRVLGGQGEKVRLNFIDLRVLD